MSAEVVDMVPLRTRQLTAEIKDKAKAERMQTLADQYRRPKRGKGLA